MEEIMATNWNFYPSNMMDASYNPWQSQLDSAGLPPVWIHEDPVPVAPNVTYMSSDKGSAGFSFGIGNTSWGSNFLNASLTGMFHALANLGGMTSASAVYDYYKKQQQEYLASSAEMARRYQIKGDLALSKLQVQHALSRGTNELAVAGAKGRLSGSNLDKLVANEKYNQRDERTQRLETLWQVSNIQRQGYIDALNASFAAQSYAYKQKAKAWNTLTDFLSTAVGALGEDYRQDAQQDTQATMLRQDREYQLKLFQALYGKAFSQGTLSLTNTDNTSDTSLLPITPGVQLAPVPSSETNTGVQPTFRDNLGNT